MKSAGRPIGQRIRKVLEVSQQIGPATTTELGFWLTRIAVHDIAKYCRRAESHGFMTSRIEGAKFIWTAVEGWESLVGVRKEVTPNRVAVFNLERAWQ